MSKRKIDQIKKKNRPSSNYQVKHEHAFKQYMSPIGRKHVHPTFLSFRRTPNSYDQCWRWNTLVEE